MAMRIFIILYRVIIKNEGDTLLLYSTPTSKDMIPEIAAISRVSEQR